MCGDTSMTEERAEKEIVRSGKELLKMPTEVEVLRPHLFDFKPYILEKLGRKELVDKVLQRLEELIFRPEYRSMFDKNMELRNYKLSNADPTVNLKALEIYSKILNLFSEDKGKTGNVVVNVINYEKNNDSPPQVQTETVPIGGLAEYSTAQDVDMES